MNNSDKEKFYLLINSVWSFYGKTLTPMMVQILWNALSSYDLQAVSSAFDRHLVNPDTGQFPPKPADVVRLLDGGTEDNAQLAWAKVDRAVRLVGSYQSVVFDDPIIHAVLLDMGGWIALGKCTEDEWPFRAREFEKRYRGYTLRGMVDYQRKLTGIAEAQNETAGQKSKPPIMIGDATKCQIVYQGGKVQVLTQIKRLDVEAVKNEPVKLVRD